MGYFTYTNSEEKLKEQYRKLLIRYDYRSGKNKKIIDEITAEYNQMVKKAKYDNGYRTTGQKVVESVGKAINKISLEAEERNNWKISVSTRKYTKEDLQDLISENKILIKKLVNKAVNEKGIRYENIQAALVGTGGSKSIYDACMRYSSEDSDVLCQQISRLKETMEYATLYLSGGNEKNGETLLCKIEDALGNYVKQEFLKIAPSYIDPIEGLEYVKKARKDEYIQKDITRLKKIILIVISIPGLIFGLLFGLVAMGEMMSSGGKLDETVVFVGIFSIVVIYCTIRILIGAIKLNVKDNYRNSNRIRAKERADKTKTNLRILRGILKLFGF